MTAKEFEQMWLDRIGPIIESNDLVILIQRSIERISNRSVAIYVRREQTELFELLVWDSGECDLAYLDEAGVFKLQSIEMIGDGLEIDRLLEKAISFQR